MVDESFLQITNEPLQTKADDGSMCGLFGVIMNENCVLSTGHNSP